MTRTGEDLERSYRRGRLTAHVLTLALGLVVAAALTIAGVDGVISGHPGETGHPAGLIERIAVGVVLTVLLLGVARWNWNHSDEVRRSHMVSFWAAMGFSLGLTFFGFVLFGEMIPMNLRLPLAFFTPMLMGCLFSLGRWLRDGYAP